MEKLYTVAFLTYNRGRDAVKSISSVACDPYVNSVRVFDDGSSEDDLKLIQNCVQQYSNVALVESPRNLGYCENLLKALDYLSKADTEYAFLCESDMLLAKGWGKMALDGFLRSPESVILSPMLHRDQLISNRSAHFRERCIKGDYKLLPNGKKCWIKKPFGSSYDIFPDAQHVISLKHQKIRYVSNSIGTLIFRTFFLKEIVRYKEQIREYPQQEDAWLSWACFAYNNFNPKSMMVLDPGLALTFGDKGLHGLMILSNLRWIGSLWWRYNWAATLIRSFYALKYRFSISNLVRFLKK